MGYGIPVRTLDQGSTVLYRIKPAAMTGGTDSMGVSVYQASDVQDTGGSVRLLH